MVVFCFCGSGVSAHGAEIVVLRGKSVSEEQFERLELWQLAEPGNPIKREMNAQRSEAVFRNLTTGGYALVCWERRVVWKPSPEFDTIIRIRDDAKVEYTLEIEDPVFNVNIKSPQNLQALYEGDAFVPCKIQRVEGRLASPFGYRWMALKSDGKAGLTGEVRLPPGSYILMIPLVGPIMGGGPPIRRRPYEEDYACYAVPIEVPPGKPGEASVQSFELTVTTQPQHPEKSKDTSR